MNHRSIKRVSTIALAVALAACGGGGESPSTSTSTSLSGQFLDSPVEGLTYSTATQSGTTDANGRFSYLAGETVTFRLYGQPLVSSPGFSTLTPGDTGVEETDLDAIVNQLRFLQTIDTDNNPGNGITLPSYSGTFNINFRQRIEVFEADTAVTAFLSANANGRPLVGVKAAVDHFAANVQAVGGTTVLSLRGKAANSVITTSKCTNGVQAGWRYAFGASDGNVTGSDTFIGVGDSCSIGGNETISFNYVDIAAGEFLSGAPDLAYNAVNFIRYGTDGDGRTVVEISWHTPGTKIIRYIKRVLVDPASTASAALSTFKETITLD